MYGGKTEREIVEGISQNFLVPMKQDINKNMVLNFVKNTGDDPVKAAIMRVTSLPEYQMC